LLLRAMLALYQSACGRANATLACCGFPIRSIKNGEEALAEIPVQASNREALPGGP
jgi:hypothetical protein